MSPVVVVLAVLQHVDVSLLEQQLALLDDEQRPADPTGVRVDPDLAVPDIAHHTHLAKPTQGRQAVKNREI